MEKIKVALRLRPMNKQEKQKHAEFAWNVNQEVDLIQAKSELLHNHPFTFDHVFTEDNSNKEVYQISCKNIIENTLEGIDTTIFVYGQTGSGKTHTMLGPPKTFDFSGVIFQSLKDIFKRIENKDDGEEFQLNCSYIEIYNEEVHDLLTKPEDINQSLQLFEDQDGKRFYVKGKTIIKIDDLEEVEQILKYGETNRRYAETYFNHKSSRSHTIFSIHLRLSKITDKGQSFIKESQINFVDLAGNERLLYEYKVRNQTHTVHKRNKSVNIRGRVDKGNDFYNPNEQKMRQQESKHINKSLFFLTQVIYQISKGKKSDFIPYRNSPLTKILRSSLGGNSRTLLILCISPTLEDFDISLSTLRFGKCAKKIDNKIKPNVMSSYDKAAIQAIIDQYEKQFTIYDNKIKELEEKQIDFMEFWRQYGAFKNQIYKRFLGFQENEQLIKNRYDLHNEELFEDQLNFRAGILNRVFLTDKEQLNKRFLGRNCQNCKIMRSLDNFEAKTIPDVFQNFTRKLEKESKIEEYFTEAMELLRREIDFKSIFIQVQSIFKNLFTDYNVYVDELIEKIRFYKTELSVYKDPQKIKTLNDPDVEGIYKQIKKVFKIYQEEKIKRNLLKEMNAQNKNIGLTQMSSEEDFKIQEKKKFNKVMENIEIELQKKFNHFEQQKVEGLKDLDSQIQKINKNLSTFIDDIYDENYNIQKFLFNYHKKTEKKLKFYEKKFEWLSKHLPKEKPNPPQKLPFKEGMSVCMSDGNLSTFSEGGNMVVNKNHMQDFMIIDKLNKRLDKIQDFHRDLNKLKDMRDQQKSEIFDKSFEDYEITQKHRQRSYSQKREDKKNQFLTQEHNVIKKIEEEKPRVYIPPQNEDPINNVSIDQEVISPLKQQPNLEMNFLKKEQESLPFETISNPYKSTQSNKPKLNSNFDISEFLKTPALNIDLNKFKINPDDSLQSNNKSNNNIPFDYQNIPPISPIDTKSNSFYTNKDTIDDLEQKLWGDTPQKKAVKQPKFEPSKIIGQFLTMRQRSKSKNKQFLDQLCRQGLYQLFFFLCQFDFLFNYKQISDQQKNQNERGRSQQIHQK